MKLPPYAELHCLTSYSFLRGASHPEELVERAVQLRYRALAITDECSLAGVVRAHMAAKEHRLKLIIGSEFTLDDQTKFILLATHRAAYGRLSHLITVARRNAEKGSYHLTRQLLEQHHPQDCLALWLPSANNDNNNRNNDNNNRNNDESALQWLSNCFPQHTWIGVELFLTGEDPQQLQTLQAMGKKYRVPLCACGDVHMHRRNRRALQDTLTAIRLNQPLSQLGYQLFPNGERHLRSRQRLQKIYPRALLEETTHITERCAFSLDELRYEYPRELVPDGHTPQSWLRHLTEQGMAQRWPQGVPSKVNSLVAHELTLVEEMHYAPYFLTVHDIVRYARRQGILCQGRGSAANSAICYCLRITEVDPDRLQLLFERFISKERNEPPDIDVDFEHERREEVIQYIYRKYGRERAALAATVITYRPRSAVRDVGKAIGMSLDQVDRLAKSIYWWHDLDTLQQHLQENGFDINNPLIKRLVLLVNLIIGFPRHLSQHVGGFVISQDQLSHLVPIENAAMDERTVIQWEKDDLEALGLLKIDILALGMLSAIRKALIYISSYSKRPMTLADIPPEDPAVYHMIQQADTIGVFQIESRAQMSMLPRLKPRNYYDLVIEIAIIRPGPIQGDMVHPYLRRRNGEEDIRYPSEAVKDVLSRTLGVPIFQEQVMQLAMVAAGFSAGEADKLRRSMAAWKRKGGLDQFEGKLLDGMKARGYSEQFAQQIFNQIKGFGEYGFPESHSASFALLAYASSWLKRYHPAAFTCALLNSQPMGFYAPAQLIIDARKHGVTVLPVDVNISEHDSTLELNPPQSPFKKGEGKENPPRSPRHEQESNAVIPNRENFSHCHSEPSTFSSCHSEPSIFSSCHSEPSDSEREESDSTKTRFLPCGRNDKMVFPTPPFAKGKENPPQSPFIKGEEKENFPHCHSEPSTFSSCHSEPSTFSSCHSEPSDSEREESYSTKTRFLPCGRNDKMVFPTPPFVKGKENPPQSPFFKGGGKENPPQSPFEKGGGKDDLPLSKRTPNNPPLYKRGATSTGKCEVGRCREQAPRGDLNTSINKPQLRLGLRLVKHLSSTGIDNIINARQQQAFTSVQDLSSRAHLNQRDLQALAAADALKSLSGDRHRAYWQVAGIEEDMPVFGTPQFTEADVMLSKPKEGQDIIADYATLGLSLRRHPLALLRQRLNKRRIRSAEQLWQLPNDSRAATAGLVICRQRPGSAGNVVFVTLEDETGQSNVVIWPQLAERQAKELLKAKLLVVHGKVQQEEGVLHLIANRLEDLSAWLGELNTQSRDFC